MGTMEYEQLRQINEKLDLFIQILTTEDTEQKTLDNEEFKVD